MTWLTRDEEIRLEAIKISASFCAVITVGMVSKPSTASITELVPFYMVTDIENYIKDGVVPKPIVPGVKE